MDANRFIVLDVETTGLNPLQGDRVIEIGAVVIEAQKTVGEFHSLIDPGRPIPPQAQLVHGISDAMLAGQPRPEDIWPDFARIIRGAVLIAHNAPFDLGFLQHEFGRLGLALPNRHKCTLKMGRRLYPQLPNHRLETLARHLLGALPPGQNLHRALDDARLAARVWLAMLA